MIGIDIKLAAQEKKKKGREGVLESKWKTKENRYGNTTIRENYNPLDYFSKAFVRQAKKKNSQPPRCTAEPP